MKTDLQVTQNTQQSTIFSNIDAFEGAQRMAKAISSSTLIPKEYQGNIANTLIALEMAQRLNVSPMSVFQNLHIIHGKPGWSAQFIIASINASGKFKPLQFRMEGDGDDMTCVAWAKDQSGKVVEGPIVSIKMAKAEGWYQKNGSKWQTLPQLMIRYRAATFFGRLYAPEITIGLSTQDELNDVYDTKQTGKNEYTVTAGATVDDANKAFQPNTTHNPEVDAFGEIYDQTKHATNAEGQPIFKNDGSFRKRRQATRSAGTAERELYDANQSSVDPNESQVTQIEKSSLVEITKAEVFRRLSASESRMELDDASELIKDLPEEDRGDCTEAYVERASIMEE